MSRRRFNIILTLEVKEEERKDTEEEEKGSNWDDASESNIIMTLGVREEEPKDTGEEEKGSNWDGDSESHKTNHEETESNLDREKELKKI